MSSEDKRLTRMPSTGLAYPLSTVQSLSKRQKIRGLARRRLGESSSVEYPMHLPGPTGRNGYELQVLRL